MREDRRGRSSPVGITNLPFHTVPDHAAKCDDVIQCCMIAADDYDAIDWWRSFPSKA